MRDIQDLIRLLGSKKMPPHAGLKKLGARARRWKVFIEGIQNRQIQDNESAREYLYQNKAPNPRYDMLIRRFREAAYALLLTTDFGERQGKKVRFAEYYSMRHFFVARILLSLGADTAGKWALLKALKESEANQYYRIAYMAAELLMNRAYLELNSREYARYTALYKLYLSKHLAETEAEQLHQSWMLASFSRRADYESILQLASENTRKIDALFFKHKTNSISHIYFRNKIFFAQQAGDNEGSLQYCFKYRDFLQEKDPASTIRTAQCMMMILDNCIRLNRKEINYESFNGIANRLSPGTYNWHSLYDMYLSLCLSTGHIKEAVMIYEARRTHGINLNVPERLAEKWAILEGFLFLSLKLSPDIAWPEGFSTNASKIVNDVRQLLLEATLYKTTLITLQVLFALMNADLERVYSLQHVIQNILSKELLTKEKRRSRLMLQIVQQLYRKGFEREIFEESTSALRAKLEMPGSPREKYDTEVIRYEKIAEIITQML
jgi:hypothetical protein